MKIFRVIFILVNYLFSPHPSTLISPFDKDDQGSVASTVNKAPTVSKRFSTIFNQSPPDTPSLREQAFYVSTSVF